MIDTILFDLDGTLLWMDLDEFVSNYFGLIAKCFADYNPDVLKATQAGVNAMIKNNGSKTNEQLFWEVFNRIASIDEEINNRFDRLYRDEFDKLKAYTSVNPDATKAIAVLKAKGYQLAICTNPLYPRVATYLRIAWAGLNPNDYSLITTFENSRFSKPNPLYYQEVLHTLNKSPKQCLMVGNDVIEDLAIKKLGVKTYLAIDNLINAHNLDFDTDYQGKFKEFYDFVLELPKIN